jgi:hypothetical protein
MSPNMCYPCPRSEYHACAFAEGAMLPTNYPKLGEFFAIYDCMVVGCS